MQPYSPPQFNKSAFNCPFCGAFAKQLWEAACSESSGRIRKLDAFRFSTCDHCGLSSIWNNEKLIYPLGSIAPLPNQDMPQEIREDYDEAREIASISPRGAAALLRLAIQKLCTHLGETGSNLNDDIANLVKKGLPEKIQKALDSVRVIGNYAVHPGNIDLKDDLETAVKLFGFLNIICEMMITQPKQIDNFYELKIPETQKAQINKRDSK